MITINVTLIVQVIQFLIFVFILNRLMFRPLLKVINEREGYRQKAKGEIKDFEIKIGQLKEEFVSKEGAARKDAAKERSDLRSRSITRAGEFIEESRKEVASIKEKTANEVGKQVNKTQPLLHDQAVPLAEVIMEQILGRRNTA